jgi:hypothetical protein
MLETIQASPRAAVYKLGNVVFEIIPRHRKKLQGEWQTIMIVVNIRDTFCLGWNYLQVANSHDYNRLKQNYPELLSVLPDLLPQCPIWKNSRSFVL